MAKTHSLSKAAKKSPSPTAKKTLSVSKILKYLQTATVLPTQGFSRPSFSSIKETAARLEAYLATGIDYRSKNLSNEDLAAPHRAPYARIRDTVMNQSGYTVTQMVQSLCAASQHCETAFRNVSHSPMAAHYHQLADHYQSTRQNAENALTAYQNALGSMNPFAEMAAKITLVQAVNNLASNAPGLGPHSTANAIVSDRLHLHPTELASEPLTPRSRGAMAAFPSEPIASSQQNSLGHSQIVSVSGALHTLNPGGAHAANDIHVGNEVLRGSLFVDQNQQVFRPRNPKKNPTGNFQNDWELVT